MRRGNNYSGPRWLFATQERSTHLQSPADLARTKCGRLRTAVTLTSADSAEVTCKNCLKKMAAQAREATR